MNAEPLTREEFALASFLSMLQAAEERAERLRAAIQDALDEPNDEHARGILASALAADSEGMPAKREGETCPRCGHEITKGQDVTSDYDDELVHFECGPDFARGDQ